MFYQELLSCLITELTHDEKTSITVSGRVGVRATDLIAMKDGRIIAQGPPGDIVAEGLVAEVLGLSCRIVSDPETGLPMVVPLDRRRTSTTTRS